MKRADKYEKEILKVIEEERLFDIFSIFAFYRGCSRATFYNNDLDKLDSIKRALENNKIRTCQSLKNKWYNSENPTLQLALFKTICTPEERKSLSMTYAEVTGADGAPLIPQTIKWGDKIISI